MSGNADHSEHARLAAFDLPASLTITTPEGFAYYALEPFHYADAVRAWRRGPAFVVGIRSIGTVLSAVCTAALDCDRMTVRPTGHPYDRELRLTPEQTAIIHANAERDAQFFIVDEGPGLSGSSFLATAEALERAGVSRARIVLIGSHDCDGGKLVARDAQVRWRCYKFVAVPRTPPPAGARPFRDWDWRAESPLTQAEWPATWAQLTPPKYVSERSAVFWRYEGVGRAGDQVRGRANALADAGLSPRFLTALRGFSGYEHLRAEPLRSVEWSPDLAERVAQYLLFRRNEFSADIQASALHEMVLHNVRAVLDLDLAGFDLEAVSPCVSDARLMPHEWIRTADDRVLKTDATMHGDDHFYPGPCDIAWDLAGTIIEWDLDRATAADFVERYERLSGDHVQHRMPQYKIAYAAFRAAYARMAASAMPGTPEAERFMRACERYIDVLRSEVQPFVPAKKVYA